MKLRRSALLGAVLATFSAVTAQAETLRLTSFEPPVAHVTANIITPWAKEVGEASNGALAIQILAGGTLGRSPAQQLKLVEDGVADIAWVIPGYTPGRFQQGTVGELPFLVKNSLSGSKAMWALHEQGLLKGDYEKFKMLCICLSSPNFVAATKPVETPEDLKGLNIRALGPTMLSAVDALGAVPIGGITGPTVAESISRGLIAGTFTQWDAVETFRLGDVITHYNTVPLGGTPMLIVMNKEKYESLSDEAKAVIDRFSGAAFAERFGTSFDQNIAEARERVIAANKPVVIDPDAALAETWRKAVAIATTDWIAENENGQAIYDAFVEALGAGGTAGSN